MKHNFSRLVVLFTLASLLLGLTASWQSPKVLAALPAGRVENGRSQPDSLNDLLEYTITDLGYVIPYSVNNKRQVVGQALGTCHAFLWENGELSYLSDSSGPLCGPTIAVDINENNQVVGHTGPGLEEQPFLWTDANANWVIDPGEYQILTILPGHPSGEARDINDLGTVVGFSEDYFNQDLRYVYWSNGSIVELTGMAAALDINNQGTIVGIVAGDSQFWDGVRWDNGIITPIHEGFVPVAVNDQGEIIGYAYSTVQSRLNMHLWLPAPAYGLPAGLNDLNFPWYGGGGVITADINELGQVIGGGKYLWQNGVLTDLHTLLPPNSGWTINSVIGINDHGDIIGTGYLNGQQRGFLLSPSLRWTLMFYLAADNNLAGSYPAIFQNLEAMANLPGVRILVLWDSNGSGDSGYYEVQYDTDLSQYASYSEGVNLWSQGELNTGATFTLSDFIQWGVQRSPSEHYALILDDHGSGLGGLAWDDTDNRDFLTLAELKLALNTAYGNTGRKMDVLYMAMCLMGMLEDAYQVRGLADYYVASEDLQTTYSRYLTGFDAQMDPEQVARLLAENYANEIAARPPDRAKAYTISVADLSQLDPLVAATNELGQALSERMAVIGGTLTTIGTLVQRYDNEAPDGITTADTYIDLYDFADLVVNNLGSEANIVAKAEAVKQAVQSYILYEAHASIPTKNVDNSHGVSIFFPATASSFYSADNYDFASGAVWSAGQSLVRSQTETTSWGGFLVDYFQATQPGGPDDPTPPELRPKDSQIFPLFLPLANR